MWGKTLPYFTSQKIDVEKCGTLEKEPRLCPAWCRESSWRCCVGIPSCLPPKGRQSCKGWWNKAVIAAWEGCSGTKIQESLRSAALSLSRHWSRTGMTNSASFILNILSLLSYKKGFSRSWGRCSASTIAYVDLTPVASLVFLGAASMRTKVIFVCGHTWWHQMEAVSPSRFSVWQKGWSRCFFQRIGRVGRDLLSRTVSECGVPGLGHHPDRGHCQGRLRNRPEVLNWKTLYVVSTHSSHKYLNREKERETSIFILWAISS